MSVSLRLFDLAWRHVCSGFCCIVFFFKQKTAYEMRISDWSSDVCSSDLTVNCFTSTCRKSSPTPKQRHEECSAGRDLQTASRWAVLCGAGRRSEERSCRERVCQYV